MPDFVDPFKGTVPRPMNEGELLRALRLDVAAELEAIHLYLAHADATDDPLAKKVLIDVAEEEIVHAGEFQTVIAQLYPEELDFLRQGYQEVMDMKAQVTGMPAAPAPEQGQPTKTGAEPTIGNLR